MTSKQTTSSKVGLMVALLASSLLTSCSFTNPSENFRVIVEGEVEKTLFDSTSYEAAGRDSLLVSNRLLTGVPEGAPRGNGVSRPQEADAMVKALEINTGSLNAVGVRNLTTMYALAIRNQALGGIFYGEFVNEGDNPVTVTVYACGERGLDTGIVRRSQFRIADFTIAAHDTSRISSNAPFNQFNNVYLAANAFSIGASLLTNGRGVLYVYAKGDPDLSLRVLRFRVVTPPYIEIYKRITPNDLRNYDLQALNAIGLKGTVTGSRATAGLHVQFANNGPNDSTKFGAFDIATEGATVNLQTLGDEIFIAGGLDFLKSRFTTLFPVGNTPGKSLDFYLTFQGSGSSMTLDFRDVGVLANARIEQH